MAPPKRNQKTQMSLLHFTKRNAVAPTKAQQPPKPKNPLRPMPRPTAPPFFKAPLPKPSLPKYSLSVADDAWELADRLMKGQRLTPKKRAFEDNAPILEDSDDDDFEPNIVTPRKQNIQHRSSTKSTTPLRDDRASMTKRSANKSNRAGPVGRIPTQQRSVFEDYGLPPKMTSLSSSEDEDDDNHVVVFEGEKSSLSGTDNEDDRGTDEIDLDKDHNEPSPSANDFGSLPARFRVTESPPGARLKDECGVDDLYIDQIMDKQPHPGRSSTSPLKGQENDLGSPIAISSPEAEPRNNNKLPHLEQSPKAAKETSPFPSAGKLRIHSSHGQEPRTVGRRKCSTGSDDVFETYLPEHSQPRRRKIRPLFNSDTDASDSEKYVCQERHRRSRLKSPPASSPSSLSSDERLDDEVPSRPHARDPVHRKRKDSESKDLDALRSREDSQDAESSDVEFLSTPRTRGKVPNASPGPSTRRQNRHNGSKEEPFVSGKIQDDRYESPVRTPVKTPRHDSFGKDVRRKGISEYIETASPSLSPPSKVKKRRRFLRLIVAESSADEQDMDALGQDSTRKVLGKCSQGSQVAAAEACSGTPKSAEWFHERDIDEFSDSSSDTRPTPRRSYVTRSVTRRRRRLARGSLSTRQPLLPVKRNISKSFDQSPDQSKSVSRTQRACPRTLLVKGSGLRERDGVDRDQAEITRHAEPEVIDLVNEDEEPVVASNDLDEGQEIDHSLSSGGGDRIKSAEFDDDAPPPFNLIALCKDGESIREMKERLGEEIVMDKVTEAQENGREIVGGEELGLTGSYNKSVFDRFSRTVVADQLGKERASKSVTEKALRGEYKFHYRGRPKDLTAGNKAGSSWRGNAARGRFANYRRKRGAS